MCVAALAWQAHPDWPLVAIGNRDEFHERPSAPLGEWENGIIAGRDLRSGGTWLGISDAGQFVLVTNLRGHGQPDPSRASRGELVTRLLEGGDAPASLGMYNPFNLIHANQQGARFLTNRPSDTIAQLTHGIYGLSNGTLDEPWAKTLHLKATLQEWLSRPDDSIAPLFDALATQNLEDFGIHPSSPSDIAVEAAETPVFIRHPVYGTRCSTVVLVDRHGDGRIFERRFDAEGEPRGETSINFRWPK